MRARKGSNGKLTCRTNPIECSIPYKMGKFNFCVPGCTNNWRNSPGLKFHTIPSDIKINVLMKSLYETKI